MCNKETNELMDEAKGMTVKEFEKTGHVGDCWIKYKGNTRRAFYCKGVFHFNASIGCYMTECVTKVLPIQTPDW
jgi:hypothetical protein